MFSPGSDALTTGLRSAELEAQVNQLPLITVAGPMLFLVRSRRRPPADSAPAHRPVNPRRRR